MARVGKASIGMLPPFSVLTRALAAGAVSLIAASAVEGATLRVPFDYSTITLAGQAAVRGDSILVWRPVGGHEYENEVVNIRQGVTLRGMEQFSNLSLRGCTINCLEAEPMIGTDDTTRVESFNMIGFPFIESIQAFSPRTRIAGCSMRTYGPWTWAGIRVHKGAQIVDNFLQGGNEGTAIEARQGTVVVAWNVFQTVGRTFALFNEGAADPAHVRFRNNTLFSAGEFVAETGPGSTVQVVNNIFYASPLFFCSASWDVRFNDFYITGIECTIDEGNIDLFPMFCNGFMLDPQSPCVGSGENGGNMGARGVCQLVGTGETEVPPATGFFLSVHPNPVRSVAEFKFRGVPGAAGEGLEIYDADGRLIDVLRLHAGSVKWILPSNIPGGVYFARVKGGEARALKFAVIR